MKYPPSIFILGGLMLAALVGLAITEGPAIPLTIVGLWIVCMALLWLLIVVDRKWSR